MVEPSEMEDTEGEKSEVVMAEEVRDWPGGEARDSWGWRSTDTVVLWLSDDTEPLWKIVNPPLRVMAVSPEVSLVVEEKLKADGLMLSVAEGMKVEIINLT